MVIFEIAVEENATLDEILDNIGGLTQKLIRCYDIPVSEYADNVKSILSVNRRYENLSASMQRRMQSETLSYRPDPAERRRAEVKSVKA